MNLVAGRRAKNSTAYTSALSYLAVGRALLTEQIWDYNYELIFAIEYLTAECELLTASKVAAENRLSMLARRAKSGPDSAAVTRLRLTLYTTLDQSDRGVEVCLEYLQVEALIGHLIRPGSKYNANTIEFGPSLEVDKSRNSSTCL